MPWQQIFPKVNAENSLGSALAGVPNFTFVVTKSNDVAKYFLRTPHNVERLNTSFTVYKLDKPPDEIIDLSRFKWKLIFYYPKQDLIEPIEFRDPEGFINAITDDMMLVINAAVSKEFRKKMDKLYDKYVLKKSLLDFIRPNDKEKEIDEELKHRVDQKFNKAMYQTTIIVYGENRPALEKIATIMIPLVHPEMKYRIVKVKKKKITEYRCPDGKTLKKKKKCPDGSKPEKITIEKVDEKLPLEPDKRYYIAVNDDELDVFLKLPVLSSELGSAAALPAIKLPVNREKDVIIGRNDAGHPVGISIEEFKRHVYVLGRTGMGKSNTLELIANELVKKHGPELAVWVVDPHGDMARDILLQVDGMIADWEDEYIERKAKEWGVKKEEIGIIREHMSDAEIEEIKQKYKHVIDLRKVPRIYYFNPVTVGFQINPLELPKMENREMAILHTVNEVMGIFEKVFQLDLFKAANVRLLLKIGTIYLFKTIVKQGRDPTLPDLFRFYLKLFKSKPDPRGRGGDDFEKLIAEIDDPDFRDLLDLVRNMGEQSFISTVGRLYDFTITEDLRAMFSSNSVDFNELIKPGNVVLWDISKSQLPGDVGELIMSVIVMRLWFAIKQRKAEVDALDIDEEEKKKMITPVILIIDEFQNIQRLQMIDVIFTEARKFGLHLVLAHQNLAQIDPQLLNTMLGNTAVQIIMAVSGEDAAKLIGQIDWAFREQLLSILPKLGKGEAIVKKIKMQIGQVSDIPPQYVRIFPAPKPRHGRDYIKKVTMYMRDNYGAVEVRKYFSKSSNERVAEDYIAGRPLEYYAILWAIGKHMEDIFTSDTSSGGAKPTTIAKELGVRVQEIETILAEMEDKGYIYMYQEQPTGGGRPRKKYILTPKGVNTLIGDVVHAAPSPEGQFMLKTAINHYIKKSIIPLFITIPPVGGGREGADAVFIPFRSEKKEWKPIPDAMWVVEVESPTEIENAKAQVRKILTKKANAPFIRIDVWVYKDSLEKLMRILDELPQVFRSKVKVVYVDEKGVPHDIDKEGKEDDTPDPPEIIHTT